MPIYWNEKVFLLTLESSYGAQTTLAANDAILATNITLSPMEGQDVSRELELPTMGAQGTLPVDIHAKMTFSVELVGSGTAGTVPVMGKLLRACAMAEVKDARSVTYNPVSRSHESAAVHFWIGDTRYALKGARGTSTIRVGASAIPRVEFELTGLFVMPSEAERITPTLQSQLDAPILVATTANTPTCKIGSQSFVMRSFTLAQGHQVEPRFLVGSESVLITGKSELIETTVEAVPLSTYNPFDLALKRTPQAVELVHGTQPGNIITITAPRGQMQRPASLEQNQGIKEWPLRIVPVLGAGNDQYSIKFT